MRVVIVAWQHHGHAAADKMDKTAEAFWWPGMYREIQEKSKHCPSCSAAGKNLKTQIPSTEVILLELLTESKQEIQLVFAGPIKSKTGSDVFLLVAVNRFSKWPTAKYCSYNGTPRTIRTNNGSCFKSKKLKEFCRGENIKRIRYTPNIHTGTGLVERTIRTFKSLTRAKLGDE